MSPLQGPDFPLAADIVQIALSGNSALQTTKNCGENPVVRPPPRPRRAPSMRRSARILSKFKLADDSDKSNSMNLRFTTKDENGRELA